MRHRCVLLHRIRAGAAFAVVLATGVAMMTGLDAHVAVAGDGAAPPGEMGAARGGATRRIARTPEFVTAVDAAIDRGVAWLRRHDRASPHGGWTVGSCDAEYPGACTALGVFTLRVCGVPRDDPRIAKALDRLRESFYASPARMRTYSVALMCLAAAEPGSEPLAEVPSATVSRREFRPDARDLRWIQDMVRWIERAQTPGGAWSYRESLRDYDHSNTQFALLALRAAARAGASVSESVWTVALDHMLDAQECVPDPPARDLPLGWGYRSGAKPYGSMTCSGVASVILCRSELAMARRLPRAAGERAARAVRCGLEWMGDMFTIPSDPEHHGPGTGIGLRHYYLYSIERAGMLAGTEWIGGHDWYGEGARYLVAAQSAAGSWIEEGLRKEPAAASDDDMETCFAPTCFSLLFLRRGTRRVADTATTPGGVPERPADAPAAAEDPAEAESLVCNAVESWDRVAAPAVRAALIRPVVGLGVRAGPPLLARLRVAAPSVRAAADAILRQLTGSQVAYDPSSSLVDRDAGAMRWRAAWAVHAARVASSAAGKPDERAR